MKPFDKYEHLFTLRDATARRSDCGNHVMQPALWLAWCAIYMQTDGNNRTLDRAISGGIVFG